MSFWAQGALAVVYRFNEDTFPAGGEMKDGGPRDSSFKAGVSVCRASIGVHAAAQAAATCSAVGTYDAAAIRVHKRSERQTRGG